VEGIRSLLQEIRKLMFLVVYLKMEKV